MGRDALRTASLYRAGCRHALWCAEQPHGGRRAFVTLRRVHGEHAELARRIDELEARYDESFKVVFDAIRALMEPPAKKARPIGLGRRTERR